ncbi:MAG: hypothetical protein KDH94_06985, partial [Coxiellaceae bacterium]|nr:hypothetical protein [Coxiellaceae bacterium]
MQQDVREAYHYQWATRGDPSIVAKLRDHFDAKYTCKTGENLLELAIQHDQKTVVRSLVQAYSIEDLKTIIKRRQTTFWTRQQQCWLHAAFYCAYHRLNLANAHDIFAKYCQHMHYNRWVIDIEAVAKVINEWGFAFPEGLQSLIFAPIVQDDKSKELPVHALLQAIWQNNAVQVAQQLQDNYELLDQTFCGTSPLVAATTISNELVHLLLTLG